MSERWINFKELRERLNPLDILASYQIKLKIKGDQGQGFCPLPQHQKHEGKRRSPSFSLNLKRRIFQCFSCGQSGNLIDLVVLLEGLNPQQPNDVRKVALLLDERYPLVGKSQSSPSRKVALVASQKLEAAPTKTIVNAPLDFELQHLDPTHPYLFSRGFEAKTIEHFGLGYCSRGLMKDRIAIPLHDATGNLIGYAGRLVDDAKIDADNPKYRFPGPRVREGINHEFHKSELLYNLHRIEAPVHDLIIVEGFASVWWLWQCGHFNVVALMGCSINESQARLIESLLKSDGIVRIFTDRDEAGRRCAAEIFLMIGSIFKARLIQSPTYSQPTDVPQQELLQILSD